MAECSTLDVVIPAYKAKFLPALLQSLVDQTSRNFSVIVSDDGSPGPLEAICKEFDGRLPLRYVRFGQNLGATDVAAHWNRSIALSRAQWILMPGDDDVLEENCIAAFWRAVAASPAGSRVFSFGVRVIDGSGRPLRKEIPAAAPASPAQYIRQRLAYEIYPVPAAYVFSRSLFDEVGGFVSFDGGWHSDDAMWALFLARSAMRPVPEAFIKWRVSGINISPLMQRDRIRTTRITLAFISWIDANCSRLGLTRLEALRLIDDSVCWAVYAGMAQAPLPAWVSTVGRTAGFLRRHSSKSLLRHWVRFVQARWVQRPTGPDGKNMDRGP